jgi:hypothetical protein
MLEIEAKYTIVVHNPKDVMFFEDCILVMNNKEYKIVTNDGTTITFQPGIWERLLNYISRLKWQLTEIYWEVEDWIKNAIRPL